MERTDAHFLLGTSLAWFGQQIVVGHFAVEEANRYNDAWSRFVAGDWTADILRYVSPDRDRALAGLAYLRANGLLFNFYWHRGTNSGSFATLAAIRRA